MDSLKKLEELNLKNEGLFKNIFGSKAPAIKMLAKNNKGNYFLNGNFVYDFGTDGTENPYLEDTWQKEGLNWILESDVEFKASYISIRKRRIDFQGTWISGRFLGQNFWGERSVFEQDGIFEGEVYGAPNESFKADSDHFISGKWKDYQNGILGKSNYKKPLENVNDVALISVPIDWVISIIGEDGQKVDIKVLKKIDDIDTDFKFETLQDGKEHVIEWETIRRYYKYYGFIIVGTSFGLLGPEYGISNVKSISVLNESPNVKVQNRKVIDFSKDANLTSFLPGKVEIVLNSKDDVQRVREIQKNIDTGNLGNNIARLKDLIQKGEVDGYLNDSFYYLKPVFNNIIGSKGAQNPRVMQTMNDLNDILELISFNSQIITEDSEVYNSLVQNLKNALDIDNFIRQEEEPQQPEEEKPIGVIDFSADKRLKKYFMYGNAPIKFQIFSKGADSLRKATDLQKMINDGIFYDNLIMIRHYIETGNIDGYSDESWVNIKPVFNNIKGKLTIISKDLNKAMALVDDTIGLIALNTKKIIKEVKNPAYNFFIEFLKKFLQVDKITKVAPIAKKQSVSQPKNSEETIKQQQAKLKRL